MLGFNDDTYTTTARDFFDGFRPWRTVHEGPAKVMRHSLAKLKPGYAEAKEDILARCRALGKCDLTRLGENLFGE